MPTVEELGDEIFSQGKGGGFSWLQEHFDPNYMAAWFVPSIKDAAVVNTGISRWHNFYIAGLDWLVQNIANFKLGKYTDIGAFCYINDITTSGWLFSGIDAWSWVTNGSKDNAQALGEFGSKRGSGE